MTNDQLFHGIVKTSARWLQNETSACEQHFATWQECKTQLLQENESDRGNRGILESMDKAELWLKRHGKL